MESTIKRRKQFERFVWIDICEPNRQELEAIAKEFQLDLFQIKDSLQVGHLPKFEKQHNYDFLILRAFTTNIDDCETTITGRSNKIAFFFNPHKLITIHREAISTS